LILTSKFEKVFPNFGNSCQAPAGRERPVELGDEATASPEQALFHLDDSLKLNPAMSEARFHDRVRYLCPERQA